MALSAAGRVGLMVWGVVVVGACAPTPVSTFEAFYQATARKDVVAVRALLCAPALVSLAAVDDDSLLRSLAVTRVVRQIDVRERKEDSAVLDVHDATGQQTAVSLERSPTGWCVAGVSEAVP